MAKKIKNLVQVLCTDSDADYNKCFNRFVEKELTSKVKWMKAKPKDIEKSKSKFLLLVNVKTRIPEDVECAFEKLKLEEVTVAINNIFSIVNGRGLEQKILVVAMLKSDCGTLGNVYSYIGAPDHRLHDFRLTNIFYSGIIIWDDHVKDKAKIDIEEFLREEKK